MSAMKPVMQYKGYRAAVTFDDSADVFHGEVAGDRDVIAFEGASVEELRREFAVSIDDYLAVCAERGREPDKAVARGAPVGAPPPPKYPARS